MKIKNNPSSIGKVKTTLKLTKITLLTVKYNKVNNVQVIIPKCLVLPLKIQNIILIKIIGIKVLKYKPIKTTNPV